MATEVRALVLPGGGMKGAYQVGALRHWMLEQGIDYPIMCGVSVGALNVAGLSAAPLGDPQGAYQRLSSIWDRVENRTIRRDWPFFGKLATLWKKSVYDARPLMKWVHQEVHLEEIRNSGREVRVGIVSWNSKAYRSVGQDDDGFADYVYASASFPMFFQPLDRDGHLWTDGGLINVTPIKEAVRLGATHVDIIMNRNPAISDPWEPKGKNILDWVMRSIEIQQDEILRTDLEVVGLKNDLADLGKNYRNVSFRLLEPQVTLSKDPLDFDPKKIAEIRQRGYDDARAMG